MKTNIIWPVVKTIVSTSSFCGIDEPSHSSSSASLIPASVKELKAACKIGLSGEFSWTIIAPAVAAFY